MKNRLLLILFSLTGFFSFGQVHNNSADYSFKGSINLGKGSASYTPTQSSSWLEIGASGTTKGLILPRVNDTSNIAAPTDGMMIHSLGQNKTYIRRLGIWRELLYNSVSGYLDVSDTSNMLNPYLRKSDTANALANYVRTIGVTTANGVSATSSGGQNPRLTITLGAITPTSVLSAGAITGTTISGLIVTPVQSNITSLGILSNLTISGTATTSRINSSDSITALMIKSQYVRFGPAVPGLTLGTPFSFSGNGHTQVTQTFGLTGIGYEGAWVLVDGNSFLNDQRKAMVTSVRLGHRNSTRQSYIADLHATGIISGVSNDYTFFTFEPFNGASIFPLSHIDSSYVPGIDKMLWINGSARVFDTLYADRSIHVPNVKLSTTAQIYQSGTGIITELGTDGQLWYINGAYRGIFNGSGHLLLGGLTDNGTGSILQVTGTANATAFVPTSDMRQKKIEYTYEGTNGINIYRFKWDQNYAKKNGIFRDTLTHWGYGAQQLLNTPLKNAVYLSENSGGVNYDEVHTYEIMMLKKDIESLKETVKSLQKSK